MIKLTVNSKDAGAKVWPPYCWEIELAAGEKILQLDLSGTPDAAFTVPEHLKYLRENNFNNAYFERCMEFEKIFPDESPLTGACLI